jgi:hypothetical protein
MRLCRGPGQETGNSTRRLRRHPERGAYDRDTIHAILGGTPLNLILLPSAGTLRPW